MNRIAINCRVLAKPSLTGVGRYALELLDAATSNGGDGTWSYRTFGIDALPDPLSNRSQISTAGSPAWAHSGPLAHTWEQLELPRVLGEHEVDLLHTPAGHAPILGPVPQVTTIHDISPITHPEWFSRRYAALYRILTPLTIRASDRIITVSEFARNEIIQRFPEAREKTVAIPNGVAQRSSAEARRGEAVPAGEFLLFVGSRNPRKNLDGLVRAYHRYRRRTNDPVPLVLAGPERNVFASTDLPAVAGVRTLGFVSDDELNWLYHNARALVFPSLYEGFGLPILEAMSVGTPVITSDRGAMAEVAGEAARLIDPTDPADIARGILRVLEDDQYADALMSAGRTRAAEFTWERTASETLDVYREVANL